MGDGGSPIMYPALKDDGKSRIFQQGIASHGLGCGNQHPSVYTRVSKYMHWILDNIHA